MHVKKSLEENTMNENKNARQHYDSQEVNKTSVNVLNRRANKVIDADAEHAAKIARQIRDRKAAARHLSPIMEVL